ncbi:orf 52 [Ateline gammaherpesvirus 3]|uniref:Orf 52 n=1 Tax=Ateline herpesvirus 3 TaxID=85618 RepID=Q9YTL4_ATHV3|nr:orf 52 [Ateline gammaherpesvirus 3]AAC95577.1 orf 52 [Ateline gammaherpesvirus 3]
MASGRASSDVEELQKELQKLKLENKALKKKMLQGNPEEEMLTPPQKEILINSLVSKLTKQAELKIRERVTKDLLPLVTKNQCMEAIADIKYRIDVSTKESQDRPRKTSCKLKTSK